MRYALRTDANQAQVISALEAAGAKVDVIGKPTAQAALSRLIAGRAVLAKYEIRRGFYEARQRLGVRP